MSFLKSSLPVIFCFLCLPSATRSFSNKFQGNPSARRGSQPKRRITFSTRLSSVAAGGISSSGGGSTAVEEKKAVLQSIFDGIQDIVLACPISLEPLNRTSRFYGQPYETWRCSRFGTAYRLAGANTYLELVPPSAQQKPLWQRSLQEVVQTDTFRNPFVAFVYERGWRQGFANAGFPGVDSEFEKLLEFWGPESIESKNEVEDESDEVKIRSVLTGTLLDMSCGSGLMSRRIAKHGTAERVISADFSEAMLLETARRLRQEVASGGLEASRAPDLIRCDVARLPIQTGSVDGVHAGAALHCWPLLEEGLSEIHRSLSPGGKFFATTFKKGAYGIPRQVNDQGGASFRFFEIDELEQLLKDAGFSDVNVELVGQGCLIARCIK